MVVCCYCEDGWNVGSRICKSLSGAVRSGKNMLRTISDAYEIKVWNDGFIVCHILRSEV